MAVTGSPPALGAAASLQPWVRQAAGEGERSCDREPEAEREDRQEDRQSPGRANVEQRGPLPSGHDEVAEDPVTDVLGAGGRADQDRGDVPEPGRQEDVVLEIGRAAGGAVVARVHGM